MRIILMKNSYKFPIVGEVPKGYIVPLLLVILALILDIMHFILRWI